MTGYVDEAHAREARRAEIRAALREGPHKGRDPVTPLIGFSPEETMERLRVMRAARTLPDRRAVWMQTASPRAVDGLLRIATGTRRR